MRVYVVDSDCGYQGDHILLHKVLDVENGLVWRGECDLVLEIGSRVRRLGKKEQCYLESWVENALHVGARNGRLRHANVILTWRMRREKGGGFDCYVSCGCNTDGVCLGEGDALPMYFLARLG